jgi:hypothetical protein
MLATIEKEYRTVRAVRGALRAESADIERLTLPQAQRLYARLADLFGVDDLLERESAAILQSRGLS